MEHLPNFFNLKQLRVRLILIPHLDATVWTEYFWSFAVFTVKKHGFKVDASFCSVKTHAATPAPVLLVLGAEQAAVVVDAAFFVPVNVPQDWLFALIIRAETLVCGNAFVKSTKTH